MYRSSQWKIGIVGAGGELGHRVVDALIGSEDCYIVATSRDLEKLAYLEGFDDVECRQLDLMDPDHAARQLRDCELIVFCPILTLSLPTAQRLREKGSDARLVLFSSNNVGLDEDAEIYRALRDAEGEVSKIKEPWAMIRPTMIYGTPNDGNLGRLMRLARKSPVLPLMGSGEALQQPIHYDDLAGLVIDLMFDMDWRRVEIGAAGPDICSLRELYGRVIEASEKKARILSLPTGLISFFAGLAERLGMKPPLSTAQLARLETDKLPTWPMREGWMPEISLDEGLDDILDQIESEERFSKMSQT